MNSTNLMLCFALFTVFTFSVIPFAFADLGDKWNEIKSSLQKAENAGSAANALSHLDMARQIYVTNFKQAATELDFESDQLIETSFSDITDNLEEGKIVEASLNRQIIDKTIYKISFLKIEQALENHDPEQLMKWFSVIEAKFSISEKDFATNNALKKIQADSEEIPEYSDIIKEEILSIFKLKTIEELEEAVGALEKGDVNNARKFTYEGLYYYRTLHPSVIEKLGQEEASELLHEMEEAVKVTNSGSSAQVMKQKLEEISSEVELLIREYEGGETSGAGFALSGIKDRLNLVAEEYSEAVSDGAIVDQEEYDETVIFLNKAMEIFSENHSLISELSTSDADSLEKNMDEIKSLVDNLGNPNQVTILVGKSLNNIASLEELAGGTEEITAIQYIDNITKLLKETKSAYRSGDSEKAFELATEAYLDNYEFVEAPLGELDNELMLKIENDMRVTLRDMIQSGESPDEVDAHINMILVDLETARKIVPEFGPIVISILVIGIITTIIVTRKRNFIQLPA